MTENLKSPTNFNEFLRYGMLGSSIQPLSDVTRSQRMYGTKRIDMPSTLDIPLFFFLIRAVGLWVLRPLLAYCTSPG
jgi:hypothetical protein